MFFFIKLNNQNFLNQLFKIEFQYLEQMNKLISYFSEKHRVSNIFKRNDS